MASFHTTSRRTAVAGVLAAGSLAVLWLACMVPSGRIGLTGAWAQSELDGRPYAASGAWRGADVFEIERAICAGPHPPCWGCSCCRTRGSLCST